MMDRPQDQLDNEKDMTELTIAPDGRVFAFGTSKAILEVFGALCPHDRRVRALLEQVRGAPVHAAAEGGVR